MTRLDAPWSSVALILTIACGVGAGCTSDGTTGTPGLFRDAQVGLTDASIDDAAALDADLTDEGIVDSGADFDSGVADTGAGGDPDAETADATLVDAGASDAGVAMDAEPPQMDAGAADAEPMDATDPGEWSRTAGSMESDFAGKLALGPQGRMFVVGQAEDGIDFGSGPHTDNDPNTDFDRDCFINVLEPDGTHVWSRLFFASGINPCEAVTVAPDGDVVFGGSAGSIPVDLGGGLADGAGFFMVSYTRDGTYQWERRVRASWPRDIGVDPRGELYVVARETGEGDFGIGTRTATDSDVAFARYSVDNDVLSATLLGADFSQSPQAAIADNGSNYLIGGTYLTGARFGRNGRLITTVASWDAFVIRVSRTGRILWAVSIGSLDRDDITDIVADGTGHFIVSGHYQGSMRIGGTNYRNRGSTDIFLMKLNSSGQIQWFRTFGGPGADRAYSLAVDADNNIYMAGEIGDGVNFGLGVQPNQGFSDAYIAKFEPDGTTDTVRMFGGPGGDRIRTLAIGDDGALYTAGSFSQTLMLPGGMKTAVGGADVFFMRLLAP